MGLPGEDDSMAQEIRQVPVVVEVVESPQEDILELLNLAREVDLSAEGGFAGFVAEHCHLEVFLHAFIRGVNRQQAQQADHGYQDDHRADNRVEPCLDAYVSKGVDCHRALLSHKL